MADGITLKLRGGEELERRLLKIERNSIATRLVKSSLTKASGEVRKSIRKEAPRAKKSTTGFKTSSRNVAKGQLRKSVTSSLLNKVNVDRTTFLAAVFFKRVRGTGKMKGQEGVNDGFHAKFVIDSHAPNAFGFTGGNDFLSRGVRNAKGKFIGTMGRTLAKKIAQQTEKELNR